MNTVTYKFDQHRIWYIWDWSAGHRSWPIKLETVWFTGQSIDCCIPNVKAVFMTMNFPFRINITHPILHHPLFLNDKWFTPHPEKHIKPLTMNASPTNNTGNQRWVAKPRVVSSVPFSRAPQHKVRRSRDQTRDPAMAALPSDLLFLFICTSTNTAFLPLPLSTRRCRKARRGNAVVRYSYILM